jgi:hypothetical protein
MSFARHKGAHVVVNELMMRRAAAPQGTFLIVEGEGDRRFFRPRIDRDACAIVLANGKASVLGAMERLNAQAFMGALGVVDDDCDSLDGRTCALDNLIALSEARDLDAWLVWSPALDKLLVEHVEPHRLDGLGGGQGIRQRLAAAARPFGELRRWSAIQGHCLDFKRLQHARFVDAQWMVDQALLYAEAAAQRPCDPAQLQQEVQALSPAPDHLIAQGHDLLALLHRGMVKGGILDTPGLGVDQLRASLRLALERAHWGASQLARDIRAWEATNPPFRCLCSAA